MAQRPTPHPALAEVSLEAALDAAPDGLVALDPRGRVAFCNREAGALLTLDPRAIRRRAFAEIVAEAALDLSPIQEMLEAGRAGAVTLGGDRPGAVFATLRRVHAADASQGHLLSLRDLAVFDHARRQAEGRRDPAAYAGAVERRLRPDFARQRNLSPWLDRMLSRGERALLQGARVILTGESGVGKTEIARHLHQFVADAADPFVAVNCAAIPENLFESELFGYEKGAFTGASAEGRKGLIETAEGGTLFLDEVGEIPLHLQAKLLTFLEDGEIRRIGAHRPRRVNARVISATNRDLPALADERRFRSDLYYRLAVVTMPLRPLRETPEILDHLIDRFLATLNQRRADPMTLSDDLRARLRAYAWPGNVRELWNMMQQISVLGPDEDSFAEDMPRRLQALGPAPGLKVPGPAPAPDAADRPSLPPAPLSAPQGLRAAVAAYELRIIEEAIRIHGSKRKAAAALGVDIGAISRKTRKPGLNSGESE